VVAAGADAAGAGAADDPLDDERPTTETASPVTATGTFTDTIPCVPDRRPEVPVVVGAETGAEAGADAGAAAAGAAAAGAAGEDPPLTEWPTTLIASCDTVTGAVMPPATWVPDAMPSTPDVVAAFAAVAPTAQRPPTKQAPMSPRKTYLFMVITPVD
jgi:hypothetical protein